MMMNIKVIQGDITTVFADAIVNAANSSLLGGGGVDGAIHRAGGSQILEDCIKIRNRQGGCPTGEAVITRAGNLPCRFVIHTAGPVWQGGGKSENALLAACYINSLMLAAKHICKSVAFPNISTGVYGFPKQKAAEIAIKSVQNFLKANKIPEEIIFVCFDKENFEIYNELISMP